MDLISLLSSAMFKSMKTNGKLVICPENETNQNQDFLFSNQCSVCGKPFQDLEIFSQHIIAHAEKEKKILSRVTGFTVVEFVKKNSKICAS